MHELRLEGFRILPERREEKRMTNTIFFYNTIREQWSPSTSTSTAQEQEENPDTPQPHAVAEAVSLHSTITNACLACIRPPAELRVGDDDDDDSTPGIVDQWVNGQVTGMCRELQGRSGTFSLMLCGGIYGKREINGLLKTRREVRTRFWWRSRQPSGNGLRLEDPPFVSSQELSSAFVPPTPRAEDRLSRSSNLKCFRFIELKTATRNFHPNAALGSRSLSMFKGWVDEHTLTATRHGIGVAIAIKLLNRKNFQNQMKWWEKAKNIGSFYHPNLVRLLGYCSEDKNYILVYEFMSRGSLENFLFRRIHSEERPGAHSFSWDLRMKVALGAAQGLAYLHSHGKAIVHGNFKPSNILLDENYNVKLTDFGLRKAARLYSRGVMETIDGDLNYGLDSGTKHHCPEYYYGGVLTDKSDIYSFGVVLLEILCGRVAIDNTMSRTEADLVEWAKPFLDERHGLRTILDSRLEGQCPLACVQKLAILAGHCLSMDAKSRPNIDTVVKALQKLKDYGRHN